MDLDTTAQKIMEQIDKNADKIKDLSLYIHSHPETASTEYKAAKLLCDELEKNGFKVERGLKALRPLNNEEIFLDTAFKAILKGKEEGSKIAILLEYDALPIGHGCGHNLICAAGLSAALGLGSIMKDLPGTLVVYGTPAEENGLKGNKTEMVHAGHFKDIDIVLANHPGDRWDTKANWLAFRKLYVDFHGVASHAASAPEKGVSALKAAYLFFNGVDALREFVRSDARMHGRIVNGGKACNIVPDYSQVEFGVRAFDLVYVDELKEKVTNIIKGACLMTGAKADYEWGYGVNAPIIVPTFSDFVAENMKKFEVEKNKIKPWAAYASTDLGEVGVNCPTVNLFYSAAPEGIKLHTEEMVKASCSEYAMDNMILASKILAYSAYKLFSNQRQVEDIKEEFEQIRRNLYREM
ncbi:MAG: M20 family metallopeptidase [Tepidanaerobacteraceae bacterium]|nr:M20 family metallopeptidase [Tepidanaerobacteraceae bacterium]